MLTPVLLSGGVGSRLWPLSTPESPKQFLRIPDQHSLLQAAAQRVMTMEEVAAPVVVTGSSLRTLVAEHLTEIGCQPQVVLSEPVGRNTAPAALAAALWADPDDLLLGLPTDHLVDDVNSFQAAVREAVPSARRGNPVIFGIPPTIPRLGLGYMKVTATTDSELQVRRFVEKPDQHTAQQMVESGDYLWNGGMFLVRAEVMRDLVERLLPEVAEAVKKAHDTASHQPDGTVLLGAAFAEAPPVSVAKGLWERAEGVRAVTLDAGWSDIGSWEALGEVFDADSSDNVINGTAIVEAGRGVHVHAPDTRIAVVGVSDVVVVAANDRLLVVGRDMGDQTSDTVGRLEDAF